MWEAKTSDGGLSDAAWTFTWFKPVENSSLLESSRAVGVKNGGVCSTTTFCDTTKHKQQANLQRICGYNGWKVPTLRQLNTLAYVSGFDAQYFSSDNSQYFWADKFGLDGETPVSSAMNPAGVVSDLVVEGGSAVASQLMLVRKAP